MHLHLHLFKGPNDRNKHKDDSKALLIRNQVCVFMLPQKHLAGSAVGVLVERVHLEVMLVGCGSLWLDVGPARQKKKKFQNLKFGGLHFISRGFLKCNSCVKNSQRSVRR